MNSYYDDEPPYRPGPGSRARPWRIRTADDAYEGFDPFAQRRRCRAITPRRLRRTRHRLGTRTTADPVATGSGRGTVGRASVRPGPADSTTRARDAVSRGGFDDGFDPFGRSGAGQPGQSAGRASVSAVPVGPVGRGRRRSRHPGSRWTRRPRRTRWSRRPRRPGRPGWPGRSGGKGKKAGQQEGASP